MKTKIKTVYRCSQCAHETPRWMGQCAGCNSWNTLEEGVLKPKAKSSGMVNTEALSVMSFAKTATGTRSPLSRHSTGFPILDSVLGGGLLDGTLVLLGGAPGVGKSTLTSHISGLFSRQNKNAFVASGEEEAGQIAERLERLGIPRTEQLFLASGLTLEEILLKAEELMPKLLVVDSVQTIGCEELPYPVGSPTLIRALTARLLQFAKRNKAVVFLLGHITKDGLLAGPKHMEHMVDVVLQMEKPRDEEFRMVRVTKNRFGPTNQLVVFSMNAKGLSEVTDPSASFLSSEWRERLGLEKGRVGLASTIALDGGQPFLIQTEALIGKKKQIPGKRASLGIERTRLEVILAVLEKTTGLALEFTDVFASLVGGIKVKDPGADLALMMALASAALEVPIPSTAAYIGEISLSGDVLRPRDLEARVRQAKSLGYQQIFHAREGLYHVRDFIRTLKNSQQPARSQ